jgi:hypothetical protein
MSLRVESVNVRRRLFEAELEGSEELRKALMHDRDCAARAWLQSGMAFDGMLADFYDTYTSGPPILTVRGMKALLCAGELLARLGNPVGRSGAQLRAYVKKLHYLHTRLGEDVAYIPRLTPSMLGQITIRQLESGLGGPAERVCDGS